MIGLPGSGVGGMFYLLSAALMPFTELIETFRGRSSAERWQRVAGQSVVAYGIMGVLWLTGWALGEMLVALKRSAPMVLGTAKSVVLDQPDNVLKIAPMVISLTTLLVLMLGVQALRLFFRPARAVRPEPATR